MESRTAAGAPHIARQQSTISQESASSTESDGAARNNSSDDDTEGQFQFTPAVVTTPLDEIPSMSSSASYSWAAVRDKGRGRSNSGGVDGLLESAPAGIATNGTATAPVTSAAAQRQQRPSAVRMPSNAYAPPRRPTQYSSNGGVGKHRNSSTGRGKRNPNAEYRAQERTYIQRIRQDLPESDDVINNDLRTPSLDYSSTDTSDDESPSAAEYIDDHFDQDAFPLYYGNEDMQPSVEELKIPENRERLEWHSMLASVLTGDVFKQEKKRLIGGGDQQADDAQRAEIWLGIRAKCCGRLLQAQRRLVEEGRSTVNQDVENIIAFSIKGETEVGKTPAEQVEEVVKKLEKLESLFPTRAALKAAHPRAGSEQYDETCDAIIAWHNTMQLINTELSILQSWVGNDELDFSKARPRDPNDSHNLSDDSSFIERMLKEDGLKFLQGKDSLLVGLNSVINKAKNTLISNAKGFADRHLPPYIEELQTLINFPSRLVQEIIRMRLSYAKKMKDPSQQGVMMTEQLIGQFQILLTLAVRIKNDYTVISTPENGWDPPECLEEGFDMVVLDALKFYFRLLNWKLSANKNAFKEAEILEQEWEFCNKLGRNLEGGDVEVAEQFSSLTSKSLLRLSTQFEKELQRRPDEVAGADMDKRYKTILDSVRVRQRKLFRFSRILTQRFENCAEYSINLPTDQLMEFYDALVYSGHFLVQPEKADMHGTYIIASPALQHRPGDVQSLLGTCYHAEENPDDPSNPYVLILKPEQDFYWPGMRIDVHIGQPTLDVQTSRLRIIADGSQQRLANAKIEFGAAIGMELTVLNEQRANLPRVNTELKKIKKTAFKLSNTIMDSVEIVRRQTVGLECQELIQTCFGFATEFGQRSILYMDLSRRALNNLKLMRLALDWVSFICDDCVQSERKTFRWAVTALEFAMMMTRGQNILSITEQEYAKLRTKVAGCMSLLISHFDIMGARSNVAAQQEKQRIDAVMGKHRLDVSRLKDDEESARAVREQWLEQLVELDEFRKQRHSLGRVLQDSNEADRALTYLSASATNVQLRWQQGQFVGGGTFGSVYAAINLDSGQLMAVKEIRLQDPQLIPTIVAQIRDEMTVLQVLDHPNIVSYFGIEPHRDKVYIFMEYCDGGSLAGLLEHGRIEDETVIMVYALQMLEGLAYLHERSVVHRDIKPENILLDHDGVIKFVDFGAAKVIARQGRTLAAPMHASDYGSNTAARQGRDANNTGERGRQNSIKGTPMYMSPEIIQGNSEGRLGAADIWSLGCVILEMATGRRPWANLDNEFAIMFHIASGNPPQLPSRDQLSDSGIQFLRMCFERDPSRRASAAELLQTEWIMVLRNQLSLEPSVVTPSPSESSSIGYSMSSTSSGGANLSRQGTQPSGAQTIA